MPEFMQLMESWDGFNAVSDLHRPEGWDNRVTKLASLITETRLPAYRREYLLREALTTSDFPYLFGDILDRSMLAMYETVPAEWRKYMKRKVNRDFRTARMYATYGGDTILEEVAEKGEYLASSRDELYYEMQLKKFGRQFDISWEALVNDDLGALTDTPQRFAMAAANTEHYRAVLAYCNDIGAHVEGVGGNLYENGVNAGTDPLTIGALEDAVAEMRQFRSLSGMPILNRPRYLVVPPALEFTARQILTSTNKMWLATGDTDAVVGPYPTTNVIANYGLELIVDDFLPYCHEVLNSGLGDTAWYLFADPANIGAVGYGQLAGHERPEICMKASDKVAVGGGLMDPMSGDFATDNVFYRVRLVFNTAKLDWRATWMSTGAGS